jgi:hypothetical protein
MNEEQKNRLIKETLSAEVKKRLYLYSYIALIVLSFCAVLFAAISLIVDANVGGNQQPSMICSYVCLGFAVVSLILLSVLSAFYFVNPEDASLARIHGVSLLRVLIRFTLFASGIAMMSSSFLGLGGDNGLSWRGFARGWGITLLAIEGIMFVFSLWKNAWIKENPERYLTPVYPLAKKKPAPASKPSGNAVVAKEEKKAASKPKTDVFEVEVEESDPKAIEAKKK